MESTASYLSKADMDLPSPPATTATKSMSSTASSNPDSDMDQNTSATSQDPRSGLSVVEKITPQETFIFFDLPAELRLIVWEFYYDTTEIKEMFRGSRQRLQFIAPLITCRSSMQEGAPVYIHRLNEGCQEILSENERLLEETWSIFGGELRKLYLPQTKLRLDHLMSVIDVNIQSIDVAKEEIDGAPRLLDCSPRRMRERSRGDWG